MGRMPTPAISLTLPTLGVTPGGTDASSWGALINAALTLLATKFRLQLIETRAPSGVQTTTFGDVTPLAGDTDGIYVVVAKGKSAAAGDGNGYIKPNGALTNVTTQFLQGAGGSANANNGAQISFVTRQGGTFTLFAIIWATSGGRRAWVALAGADNAAGAATDVVATYGVWNDTATVLTTLALDGGAAAAWGAGSTVSLYRLGT